MSAFLNDAGELGFAIIDTITDTVTSTGDNLVNQANAAAARIEYVRSQTAIQAIEAQERIKRNRTLTNAIVGLAILFAGAFAVSIVLKANKK